MKPVDAGYYTADYSDKANKATSSSSAKTAAAPDDDYTITHANERLEWIANHS